MALDDDFVAAKARVQKLTKAPGNDELLELYALFKQATEGDVKGARPGMMDFKGRAKYDAWSARKGTSVEDAKQAYIATVGRLEKKYV
jgi:diazepam-binding inhibitor (GABA receptor modulating acyl-CoA-binding protein)